MHFSEVVSIGQSLFISIFSMLIVFLVLCIISYVIDLTAKIIKAPMPGAKTAGPSDSDELVAVITAAISAHEEGRNFKITNVKEADKSWANSSRQRSVK